MESSNKQRVLKGRYFSRTSIWDEKNYHLKQASRGGLFSLRRLVKDSSSWDGGMGEGLCVLPRWMLFTRLPSEENANKVITERRNATGDG